MTRKSTVRLRRARSVENLHEATPVMRALYVLMQESIAGLIAAALEAELQQFLRAHATLCCTDGTRAVVRNGYLPPRAIVTSAGEITVRVPRTRDRSNTGIAFNSALVPPYVGRTRINRELPQIFLRSCLDGDALAVLRAVLGEQVAGISPGIVNAAQQHWSAQCLRWRACAAEPGAWLYWWAGSIQDPRVENGEGELLFVTGLHHDGRHALVAVTAARKGNATAWQDLLRALRQQYQHNSAKLCEAGHRPDIWQAVKRHFPDTLIPGYDGSDRAPFVPSRQPHLFRSYP